MNCWEFKKCQVKEGCPAYQQNKGKECASVAGTLCVNGIPWVSSIIKLANCYHCPFMVSEHYKDPTRRINTDHQDI